MTTKPATELSPDVPRSVEEPTRRRPYTAPALSELGSVEELTRGSGSGPRDARTTTRRIGNNN